MHLKDIVTESIYKMDENNPMDPEVLVQGVGRYKLSQVKDNVRKKFEDLHKRIEKSDDPSEWRDVAKLINHGAMHEMIKTIVNTHDELQDIRRKGGTNSTGIIKEMKTKDLIKKKKGREGIKNKIIGDLTGERPAINEGSKTIKRIRELDMLSAKYKFALEDVDGNEMLVVYNKKNNKMIGSFNNIDVLLDNGLV